MTVNVVVIGCGYWGKNLVRNFHALGCLYGICDENPKTTQHIVSEYAVKTFVLEQIWQNEAIDAVVIATPAVTHAALAIRALQAGKHVYVEKPMAVTMEEARRVQAVHQSSDRIYMVGHLLQYHPVFLKLKEHIDQGVLGDIRYLYSHRLNLGKLRREENILWSFAPHDISMILSIVGSTPERVEAVGSKILNHNLYDITTTHLTFSNKVKAHIHVSWLHPHKEQRLVIVGDKGMMVFNDCLPWEQKLQIYKDHLSYSDAVPIIQKNEPEYLTVEHSEPLHDECAHFIACIEEGKTPRTDLNEGMAVLDVLERAERAMGSEDASYFVHESAYVDAPCDIGEGTKIWHFSHVLPKVKIGKACVIGQNVSIGPEVTIGNHCKIQNNVSVYKGVTLEDGVFCGPSAVFTNVINPRAEVEKKQEFRPTHVSRGVTIGANATILCGITLGEYAFIAAGAVVTQNVPPYALMAGVPARRIGWVSRTGESLGSDMRCPRTGAQYQETAEGVLKECMSEPLGHLETDG